MRDRATEGALLAPAVTHACTHACLLTHTRTPVMHPCMPALTCTCASGYSAVQQAQSVPLKTQGWGGRRRCHWESLHSTADLRVYRLSLRPL